MPNQASPSSSRVEGEAVSIAEIGRQQLVWLAETLQARSDIDTHLRAAAGLTVTNPVEGAALWARISPY